MSDETDAIERLRAKIDADPQRRDQVERMKAQLRRELTDDELEEVAQLAHEIVNDLTVDEAATVKALLTDLIAQHEASDTTSDEQAGD